jgi:hypothetical protein
MAVIGIPAEDSPAVFVFVAECLSTWNPATAEARIKQPLTTGIRSRELPEVIFMEDADLVPLILGYDILTENDLSWGTFATKVNR